MSLGKNKCAEHLHRFLCQLKVLKLKLISFVKTNALRWKCLERLCWYTHFGQF